MIKTIPIIQLTPEGAQSVQDEVAAEFPLTLYLEGEEWVTLLCSPDDLESLVYGFLRSEGIIGRRDDVSGLILDRDKGHGWITLKDANQLKLMLHGKRTQTSGCAKGITFYQALDTIGLSPNASALQVDFSVLTALMGVFNGASGVFKTTGGVHSCALCSGTELLMLKEDIGRHNALDKLIGEALIKDIPLGDKLLLTSGRISSEILLKSARAGLPMVVSRSAPTDLAVREAEKLGMTLIGFMRGRRCNVYAGSERIVC